MVTGMLDLIDLLVAGVTNIACIYVVIVYAFWWWHIDPQQTNLRPLILGIVLAKAAIWSWSATAVIAITGFDVSPPDFTLPARIAIMVAVLIHVWVTTRVKSFPMPPLDLNPPIKKR